MDRPPPPGQAPHAGDLERSERAGAAASLRGLAARRRTDARGRRARGVIVGAGAPPRTTIVRARALARKIREQVELGRRVVDQTRRRVMQGESVPARHKIVSIFEPHTDIIVKDRRETLYGHKVRFGFGASGLVTSARILDGSPFDVLLAVVAAEQEKKLHHDRSPDAMTFDGAFASRRNLADLKALGVAHVVFARRRGIAIEDT